MKLLEGSEKEEALHWLDEAVAVAQDATCERAKCGAIIVREGEVIGRGINSPAGDESQRRCSIEKDSYDKKVTDKTCCVHAEQRAVMDALRSSPEKLRGAQMYFARFYANGERRLNGGKNQLYCTICTKMMFDVGITDFILAHEDGVADYPAPEYLEKSFDYGKAS